MYEICIRVNGTCTIGRPLRLPISFYMEYEKGRYTTPNGYPNFLGGSNLGGNLGDNNEK